MCKSSLPSFYRCAHSAVKDTREAGIISLYKLALTVQHACFVGCCCLQTKQYYTVSSKIGVEKEVEKTGEEKWDS